MTKVGSQNQSSNSTNDGPSFQQRKLMNTLCSVIRTRNGLASVWGWMGTSSQVGFRVSSSALDRAATLICPTRLQRYFQYKESTAALLTMNASITGEYATNWLLVRSERTSRSDRGLLSISSWTKRQCWRGKRKHYIGVSHHLSMKRVKSQESMNDPVPELKFVIDKHVENGKMNTKSTLNNECFQW